MNPTLDLISLLHSRIHKSRKALLAKHETMWDALLLAVVDPGADKSLKHIPARRPTARIILVTP